MLDAARAGDFNAVQTLLQTVDADAASDGNGRTTLALAVRRSDARLARLLIERGANRLAQDRFWQTPLGHAQAIGDRALLRALEPPRYGK